jgi:hypothetical protein
MEDYMTKLYRKIQLTGPRKISPGPFISICVIASLGGFLLINNLTFVDWSGRHARETVQYSNLLFMTYDTIMMFAHI